MVYYVRFLKPPKLDVSKGIVRALVTVTTDLGDEFYPGHLTLYAVAVTLGEDQHWNSQLQRVDWKYGMRTAWIEVQDMKHCSQELLQLVVTTQPALVADKILLSDIPEVLSVRSDSFGRGRGWEKRQADSRTERRYMTSNGQGRIIHEEMGESIARHIWDAGVSLAAYLSDIASASKLASPLAKILLQSTTHSPRVIELGSGCGIVGLELAHTYPTSDVLLTDLPEAMAILNHNVQSARFASERGQIATTVLDWDNALPDEVSSKHWDVIIVSDCTYNSDSIPALVKTLISLVERSPAALIVVSMKVRHDSEAIFFDLMAGAKLEEVDRVKVSLPDRQRKGSGQPLEEVYIYIYGRNSSDDG